jgi:hypothetical protein
VLVAVPGLLDSSQQNPEAAMRFTAAERQQFIDRYEKGPEKLRDAFAKVPREAWNWRPAPGKWSVHEILAHCADSEMNAAARIRYLVAEEKPVILGYDQAAWARVFDYHHTRVELCLASVDVLRAHTVNLLRRLPEAAWAKEGMHTESGRYTAEDWLEVYAEHLEKHSRQIEKTLAAWRQEETQPGVEVQ